MMTQHVPFELNYEPIGFGWIQINKKFTNGLD